MKYQIMIKMLMLLTSRRKATAAEIADRFEISVRSVYRYVEELNVAGVPVDVVRGRYGGIFIADTFRLPSGYFTRGEYAAVIDALTAMSASMADEDIASALEKVKRQQKSDKRELSVCGNIIVDGGAWADLGKFPQKMKVCEQAVRDCHCLEIDYISREGEHSKRIIDPHVLIFKQNVWYVFAFCHTRQDFRTFKIGRIKGARFTGRTFVKREINKQDIPLNFEYTTEQLVPVTLEIRKDAIADVEEWLGVDNIEPHGNGLIANVSLPDDDTLVDKILSYGGKVRVVSPLSLKEKVKAAAYSIYNSN
ncbi:MAG: YafY family transcriptional regulator [Clostridia bacterium]|nr:YafY family transcriptional regulator [Clostridia bacterium]